MVKEFIGVFQEASSSGMDVGSIIAAVAAGIVAVVGAIGACISQVNKSRIKDGNYKCCVTGRCLKKKAAKMKAKEINNRK